MTTYIKGAPGEKPHIKCVYDQRVTGTLAAVFILLFFAFENTFEGVVQYIPKAVLLGFLVYFGAETIVETDMFRRTKMWFMSSKNYNDDLTYVREVLPPMIHLYTIIQVCCFAVIYAVKSAAYSVSWLFPLAYIVTNFYRKVFMFLV